MNTEKTLNLLLFGATRNTGWCFMQQALEAGHRVTAVVRKPETFSYQHPNLKVVQGDALQLSTFEREVEGKDAIVSTLGATLGGNKGQPMVVCSQGVANMMTAMQKVGVQRLVSISAIALDTNPQMGFFIKTASNVLQWILKKPYDDLRKMEAAVKASSLDWTIIRPPRLMGNDVTGKYRVAVGTHLAKPFSINRGDLAHYMLHHILDPTTYQKMVEIAY